MIYFASTLEEKTEEDSSMWIAILQHKFIYLMVDFLEEINIWDSLWQFKKVMEIKYLD